jgi:hypothetical protein
LLLASKRPVELAGRFPLGAESEVDRRGILRRDRYQPRFLLNPRRPDVEYIVVSERDGREQVLSHPKYFAVATALV